MYRAKQNTLSWGISLALAGGLSTACIGSAFAAEEEATELEKVEVTGSHIKRVDIEGPSPVLVIDREDIDRSGAANLSDLLRNLNSNSGPSFDDKFTNSFAPGSSGVSLRGLGQNATLVLLNGRRVANYGFAQNITQASVDLNSIPLGAVERVEILKDGASAIYGSDAIAGVINIILKKDYQGQEATISYGATDKGDGKETTFNFITGVNNATTNLTFNLDYFDRGEIWLRDREFSKSADHTDQGGAGNGFDFRSSANPIANVKDATGAYIDVNGVFDFNPYITMSPATKRTGGLISFNHEFNRRVSMYSQVGFTQNITDAQAAPTPLFGDFDDVLISSTQLYNTYGQDVYVRWRMLELGPRESHIETDTSRVMTGFTGRLTGSWDWDAAVTYSRSKTVDSGSNYVNRLALINAIDNDLINPFGTTANDPDVLESIKATTSRTGISTLTAVDNKYSGELFDLPSGPVSIAVGWEYRRETLSDTPDKLSQEGQIIGSGGTSSNGDRDLLAEHVEFGIPVFDSLELQLALRHEDYSDFGTTTNPKIGARFQPTRNLMFRASYGTGFRAPSLPELYLGDSTSYVFVNDKKRCTLPGAPAACANTQYETIFKGNADLNPEESKSFYLGTVWEPIRRLSLGLDLWRYEHNDRIDAPDEQYIVDHESQFPGAVVRGTPAFAGDPGEILYINNQYVNLSEQETQGVDVSFKYGLKLPGGGALTLSETATYVDEFKRRQVPEAALEELVGTYQYPRVRSTTQLSWQQSIYMVALTGNYIGEYDDYYTNGNTDVVETVDAFITADLQFSADTFLGKFTTGIDNVFDKEPPFANSETEGYDFATHDPRGRFIYGRYNIKF